MTFVARKVKLAKWETHQDMSVGEISADAVTSDLRTEDNALSFWQCGMGAESEVEEAVLAMAAAGNRIEKLDVVWVSRDELRADGQTIQDTDGRTPVAGLVRLHLDVSRLDYGRLGKVAHRIVTAIEEERCRRLTKARVKSLLAAAVEQGRIDPEDLSDHLKREVAQSGSKRTTTKRG